MQRATKRVQQNSRMLLLLPSDLLQHVVYIHFKLAVDENVAEHFCIEGYQQRAHDILCFAATCKGALGSMRQDDMHALRSIERSRIRGACAKLSYLQDSDDCEVLEMRPWLLAKKKRYVVSSWTKGAAEACSVVLPRPVVCATLFEGMRAIWLEGAYDSRTIMRVAHARICDPGPALKPSQRQAGCTKRRCVISELLLLRTLQSELRAVETLRQCQRHGKLKGLMDADEVFDRATRRILKSYLDTQDALNLDARSHKCKARLDPAQTLMTDFFSRA